MEDIIIIIIIIIIKNECHSNIIVHRLQGCRYKDMEGRDEARGGEGGRDEAGSGVGERTEEMRGMALLTIHQCWQV